MALLTKFSLIPFLPCAWAAMYLVHPVGFKRIRTLLIPALIALTVAAFIVWLGYRFSYDELISGIQSVRRHNAEGHISYLFGKVSLKGFWYYYPAVLAVKTPIALLLVACVACFRKLARAPLAFALGILLFAAFSNINIGVRHVLPVYIGFCVAAGIVCTQFGARPSSRLAMIALMAAHFISGAWQHPDYLAYTNECFVSAPEEALVDSDLDWGQDMKHLNARLQRAGASEVYFEPFNRGYLLAGMPFPKVLPLPTAKEQPIGWTAVSVTQWKLGGGPEWIATTPPAERVGRSILLFHR